MSSDGNDAVAVADIQLQNEADVPDLKQLITVLEQVFELDAAFKDGELSVYRRDDATSEREQPGRDCVPKEEAREQLRLTDNDEGAETDDDSDTSDDTETSNTADASGVEVSGSDEESEPSCQYCGDAFDPRGLKRHEQRCDENPDNITDASEDEEKADEVTCEHCGDSFPRRGLGPHQRFCEDNPANTDDESEDGDTQEDASDDNSAESEDTDDGGLASKKPAAIREAMENPDDLPDDPVPVGVAIQYNAGSYTCKSCETCLSTDKELTEHVNAEGHRGAFQVNRRGCQ